MWGWRLFFFVLPPGLSVFLLNPIISTVLYQKVLLLFWRVQWVFLSKFNLANRKLQRGRCQAKYLTSRTIALQMYHKSLYISLLSSAQQQQQQQQREMIKF